MNGKKEIIGFTIIIILLLIWGISTTKKAEASFKDRSELKQVVKELKNQAREVNFTFMPTKYCKAVKINGQYAFYATERDYYIGEKKYTYTLEYNTIGICKNFWKNSTRKQKITLLVHELGHVIYYKKLDSQKIKEYTEIYNKSKFDYDYYREYGKTNSLEDFATVFESIILNYYDTYNYPNNILDQKRNFIKNIFLLGNLTK